MEGYLRRVIDEKEELIQQLTEMINKPGGKQAVRFVLNSLGAIPFVGGAISGAASAWGEKEQQEFNVKITEWAGDGISKYHKMLITIFQTQISPLIESNETTVAQRK